MLLQALHLINLGMELIYADAGVLNSIPLLFKGSVRILSILLIEEPAYLQIIHFDNFFTGGNLALQTKYFCCVLCFVSYLLSLCGDSVSQLFNKIHVDHHAFPHYNLWRGGRFHTLTALLLICQVYPKNQHK